VLQHAFALIVDSRVEGFGENSERDTVTFATVVLGRGCEHET
jgi:hypothetical protein